MTALPRLIRTFLTVEEPRMRWFVEPEGWPFYFFGLFDEPTASLALVRSDQLASYGGSAAADALVARLHEWVELGMPGAASLEVRAFRAGQAPAPRAAERVMRRASTDFVWSLLRHPGSRQA